MEGKKEERICLRERDFKERKKEIAKKIEKTGEKEKYEGKYYKAGRNE